MCIIRYGIVSKRDSGKHISSWQRVSAMNYFWPGSSASSMTFCVMQLKKLDMRVMTIFTYSGLIALITIGRNTMSMMWQSCALKLVSVRSIIETKFLML